MKKNKTTPWAYQKGSTLLHRASAGFKLAFLLFLSLASFFPNLAVLSAVFALLVLLSLAAKINPLALLRGSAPLFFVVAATFLFQGLEFNPPRFKVESLKESAVYCARLGTAFAAGSLLFAVTTAAEIRKSLSRAEAFLHIKKLNLSLSLSLMLAFLPRFFEVWEDLNLAWKSRGGKKNLRRLAVILPLAVEKMMLRAAETAAALESRGQNMLD